MGGAGGGLTLGELNLLNANGSDRARELAYYRIVSKYISDALSACDNLELSRANYAYLVSCPKGHPMKHMTAGSKPKNYQTIESRGINCDYCHRLSEYGVSDGYYHCETCGDWDYCMACITKGVRYARNIKCMSGGHAMTAMKDGASAYDYSRGFKCKSDSLSVDVLQSLAVNNFCCCQVRRAV